MKKPKLVIFLLFLTTICYGQTEKGNLLAGGEVFFDITTESQKVGSTKNKYSSTFSIAARPKIGYFIMDNLVAGLELNINSSSTKFESLEDKVNTSGLAVGPFVRYYLENRLFGEALVGVGSSKVNSDLFGETTFNTIAWRLGVGYALFLGDNIALEPMINYNCERQKAKDGDSDASSILGAIEIGIGFKAYIKYK